MPRCAGTAPALLGLVLAVAAPRHATGRFSGGAPRHTPDDGVQLGRLYERTGVVKSSPGRSCGELLSMGMTDSGVYWLKPDGYVTPFQAYCDMKSFGGGWQMCYTSKYAPPRLTDEAQLAYNKSAPYRTDGYVSNCKHVPFNQLLFVLHAESRCVDKHMKKCKNFGGTSDDDEMAYFTYETTQGEAHNFFTVAGNSGRNLVSPSVQLTYNELTDLQNRYGVKTPDGTDVKLGDAAYRKEFAGSVVSEPEAGGLWENDPKYDLKSRATDFWRGRGVAYKVTDAGVVQTDQNWKYQVVVCDEATTVPVGFFVSGIEADAKGCFKTCSNWCDDHVTDHYRANFGDMFCDDMHGNKPEWCVGRGTPDSAFNEGQGGDLGPGNTAGISFKENGFRHTTFRLMSVGMRYKFQTPNSRNSGEANPTNYQHDSIHDPATAYNLNPWKDNSKYVG